MSNHTKVISLLLSLIMVLSVFGIVPFSAAAEEIDASAVGATSGTTGECTWSLDGTVLTISGNGKMEDYNIWGRPAPWGTAITEVILTDGVRSIGKDAFSGCTGLTSVTIGNSVAYIGDDAFSKCEGLTSITIPDSVTDIGEHAFFKCEGLTSITIPDSVTYIGTGAFRGCTGLTSISVSPNNSVFDSRDNCNAIIKTKTDELIVGCQNTIIPGSVTVIGGGAFSGCTGLTSIDIPDSVASIGYYAFSDCTGLTSVTIPDSVTSIGDGAFESCTGLTSIDIPDFLMSIGYYAFYGCTGLTSVTIPDSVTFIGRDAFGYYYDEKRNRFKIDGFTIYGYPGTAAEKYANDNGFTFVALEDTSKVGDADGDGEITVRDVTEVQHYLSNMSTQADQETLMLADIDKNGVLEVIDATFILRYLADIEIPYLIG